MSKWRKGRWVRAEVIWHDSTSFKSPWHDPKELIEDEVGTAETDYISSRGYLFHKSDSYVYLALSASFYKNKVRRFGDIMKIPKGCIVSITEG